MIHIFIDNNIFDFLYKYKIDIFDEFPDDMFVLCINNEVSFESEFIKDEGKRQFAEKLKSKLVLIPFFGFYDECFLEDRQRVGGWDKGAWQSVEEEIFRAKLNNRFLDFGTTVRANGLYRNEADVDLAVRSVHNIVISNDCKKALKVASEENYRVVFMTDFDGTLGMRDFVKKYLDNRGLESWENNNSQHPK